MPTEKHAMLLFVSSLLVLLHAPCNNGFTTHQNNGVAKKHCRQTTPRTRRQESPISSPVAQLSSSKGDGNDGGGGGGGWYDDYDDFVSKLDFEGGGWDSGADSPYESSSDNNRGRRGGRGGAVVGGAVVEILIDSTADQVDVEAGEAEEEAVAADGEKIE